MENTQHGIRPTLIYALLDPRDLQVRYIGKSVEPRRRMQFHYRGETRGYCRNWERQLIRLGLKPIPLPLEIVEDFWWAAEREKVWIERAKTAGYKLVNVTEGGEGTLGFSPSGATRQKMRQAKLGKVPWNKGKRTPTKVRAKQSKARAGKDPWNKGLFGPANPLYGRKRPKEVTDKISEGQRRRWARHRQKSLPLFPHTSANNGSKNE